MKSHTIKHYRQGKPVAFATDGYDRQLDNENKRIIKDLAESSEDYKFPTKEMRYPDMLEAAAGLEEANPGLRINVLTGRQFSAHKRKLNAPSYIEGSYEPDKKVITVAKNSPVEMLYHELGHHKQDLFYDKANIEKDEKKSKYDTEPSAYLFQRRMRPIIRDSLVEAEDSQVDGGSKNFVRQKLKSRFRIGD